MPVDQAARKRRGAWYTPTELIDVVVANVVADLPLPAGRPLRVLDPACGDGRFLAAVRERIAASQPELRVELTGCDVDATALAAARRVVPDARLLHADALGHAWGDERYDVVVGNPPFLSQMATATTRGGSSRHGGGPYADAAVEFLALAVELAAPCGGRVGLVLPQSVLAARDAAPVRAAVADRADLAWSWWAPRQHHFDASVNVCALGFVRPGTGATTAAAFTGVVTDRLGVPPLDLAELDVVGTLGGRAELNANFRDEYYALVPAVHDGDGGPPLVTSGLIDPGKCLWGRRPITFARRRFDAPRVHLERLSGRFPAWAARKLVPKVLVANQTRIVEAVADPGGEWLPGVPVNTVTPHDADGVWPVAAVLTSPVASVHAWQAAAGTGLSTRAVRVAPAVLGALAWPAGELGDAVAALRDRDVTACAAAVCVAYGIDADGAATLVSWWRSQLPGDAARDAGATPAGDGR
jgi:SAM-dependent methyltransferase